MAKKKLVKIKRKLPLIAYAGSLIQQSFGEENGKGFLYWDLENKKTEFVQIPNDFEYYTIDIIDGKIPIDLNISAKNPRIRIKFINTKASDITKVLSVIRKTYSPIELTSIKAKSNSDDTSTDNQSIINVGDVRNVEYQNKLILKYIADKYAVGDKVLQRIKDINIEFNKQITDKDFVRNIHWKPKKFEFSNMFSYGEDNVIDFTNMTDVYGLMAPNSSGKSALFDSLAYCMFDKCARAFRGFDVLNNRSDYFSCKFNFSIDGKDFFIKKIGNKRFNKQTNKYTVKVDTDFWTINDVGEKIILNGIDRDDTNAIIRTYIGTYEDFVLTSLSIQNKYLGFIEMKQSERKDLLVKFLDLEIFDILYSKASEDIKDITGALKEYKKTDYSKLLVDCQEEYINFEKDYIIYSKEKIELENIVNSFQNEILQWTKKLHNIDKNIIDISILQNQKESVNKKIDNINIQKQEYQKNINECINSISNSDVKKYLKENELVEENYNKYLNLLSDRTNIQNEIDLLKLDVKNKLEKLENLNKHEYDPNCPYCMNNIFVKDAIKTKQELEDDKVMADNLLQQLSKLNTEIDIFGEIEKQYEQYKNILNHIESVKKKQILYENKVLNLENELIKLQNELNIINDNRTKYEKNITNIKYNEKIQIKIDEISNNLNITLSKLKEITNTVNHNHTQMMVLDVTKKKILESIDRLQQLEIDSEAYKYYLEAVDTNGIPYTLIAEVIPNIETEVNNILSQIVDFTLRIDLDGKNINVKIVQDSENEWALELGGGMERFVSSIAIRTALVNASNLPRPNFIIVDEGFSNMDADVISQIHLLFDYLKTQFNFIICISHNSFIKDMVNNIININKINNFSTINYVN